MMVESFMIFCCVNETPIQLQTKLMTEITISFDSFLYAHGNQQKR